MSVLSPNYVTSCLFESKRTFYYIIFTDKNDRYVSKGTNNIYKNEFLHPFREFVSRSHYVKCAGRWNVIDDCESSIFNF